MQITAAAACTLRWSIAGHGAARGRGDRAAVILELRSATGHVGLGEAAPLPGMSADTLEDAERAIAAYVAFATLPASGSVPRTAAYAAAAAASPAARFAIETANLDLLAREHGVPLSTRLAALDDAALRAADAPAVLDEPVAIGAHAPAARWLPLAAVVDDPDAARRARAAGIRCLKLKLAAGDDPGRVRAIAAAVPDARLRLDANRSWPRGEVAARLAALADLPIDYVEEPCRDAHRLLDAALPHRLALDESLAELSSAELAAALNSPGLAAVVLKPTLLGGLVAARALARRAHRAGVAAIVSHGLEGPIGTAACAELALALGGTDAVGLAAHPALAGWGIEVAQLASDHVRAATEPGLGFVGLGLGGVAAACPTAGAPR